MKNYSSEYFEKKYHVLFEKLLQKDGFETEIRRVRAELDVPEGGFADDLHLAQFFIDRLTPQEKKMLTVFAFADAWEAKNKTLIQNKDRERVMGDLKKELKGGVSLVGMLFFLQLQIADHNNLFTQKGFVATTKSFSKVFAKETSIFNKFFGLELLDQPTIIHFIEKYLFLGREGVKRYVRARVACVACKHMGIDHFSARRADMQGKDEGPFSDKYIFNKRAVRRLSKFFDCAFIIIKPYATKEQALQYIEENWEHLREHLIEKNTFYKQFGVHLGRIKGSDVEKNRLVYELHKLPKKALLESYRGERDLSVPGIYKEQIIAEILKQEHGIEMTPEAIKKAAARFARGSEVKRKPADIRDI